MTQQVTYRVLTSTSSSASAYVESVSNETDEEIIERLRQRFTILSEMTVAVKKGHIRGMIVSGPPGVGKSSSIEDVVQKYNMFDSVADRFQSCRIIKGTISPVIMFQKLYEFRAKNNLLVFDDCDSVLREEEGINMIKAVLDSGKRRTVAYHKDSRLLREAGIPNEFDFEGGVIFLTNIKFANVRAKKLRDHLAALEDRCHYLDLTIDTKREKLLRIKQVMDDGMLEHLTEDAKDEIYEYLKDHADRITKLSLRTAIKAAELKIAMPNHWKMFAEESLLDA